MPVPNSSIIIKILRNRPPPWPFIVEIARTTFARREGPIADHGGDFYYYIIIKHR